jgi:hypothetical protein
MSSLRPWLLRRLGAVAVCLSLTACGSNPAGPSTSQPPVVVQPPVIILPETNLAEGLYQISIVSKIGGEDCTGWPQGLPFTGVVIRTDVRLTYDNGVTVVRSATAADGALELRYGALRPDRSAEGQMRGVGEDTVNKLFPPGARTRGNVTVSGDTAADPATTDVRLALSAQTAIGEFTGQALFRGTPVGDISCKSALWILARVQ